MSSVGRAASRGSKGGKGEHAAATAKAQKSDTKTDTAKTVENPKAQPTPEQMRIAQIIDGKSEDPTLKDKIKQVMDATHRTEGEAMTALYDCDYDLNRAVNLLIEGGVSGEWETSSKKKKNRQSSTNSKPDAAAPRGISSADVDSENWEDDTPTKPAVPADTQQRGRAPRGGGGRTPRMRVGRGSQDNQGWRGRENKENERNLEESRGSAPDRDQRDSFRRGGGGSRGGRMSNGAGRGGGRGGSRTGPRSFSGRGGDRGGAPFPRATSWNPDEDGADSKTNNFPSPEDWDNEEYTGSLSDTKVFTPSNASGDASTNDSITSLTVNNSSTDQTVTTSPGVNSSGLNYAQSAAGSGSLSAAQSQYLRQLPDTKLPSSNALSGTMSGLSSIPSSLTNTAEPKTATRGINPSTPASGITYNSYAASAANSVANAAVPSSYPSTYSSVSASVPQASSAADSNFTPSSVNTNFSTYQAGQAQPASYTATATSYNTVYGSHQDGTAQATNTQALPARPKTQRPRVPPPSKIPQSAVEMPGDGVNNIGLLDVQFGALDFGSETFDTSATEPQSPPQQNQSGQPCNQPTSMGKYAAGSGGMDPSATGASQSNMDLDPFTAAGQKAAVLSQTLTLKETLMPGSQSQQTQSSSQSNDLKSQTSNFSQQSRGPGVGVVVPSPLESLVKSDTTSVGSAANANVSGASAAGSLSYSTPSSNYQSSYSSQKTIGGGYQPSTQYNPNYSSSQSASGVAASSSNSYPASYPSNVSNQGYQNVQSVYGAGSVNTSATGGSNAGSGVGPSSGFTTSSSAGAYQNSYGTSTASVASSNKLTSVLNAAKDMPPYDTAATSSSNLSNQMTSSSSGAPGLSVPNVSGSVNNSPSLGLPGTTSLPNANNTTSTKVTNSSAKSVVQSMPPGVPPIIAAGTQYIMSQGGLQYFQQPAVYSYEEQQILPLRIPHVPAGYYDISFQQAQSNLATGREGSLANVPYSMSDARFARTDNASPVPSSLSQQNATQAHQQPMMNAAGFPPGYAAYAYYGGSVLPANYQYGTPTAMYPQVAPATNAHGNSNSTQYPKPNYGSSYGSGYESLSASQDYSKSGGGYAGGHSGGQTASKTGVGASAPSTGSSATDMYNKAHVALSKVNSYDKGFHSGTPPPFSLAGNQNTGMAPSGAFPTPLYIPPPMPQQHHHSTTLMQHPVHQQMDMRNSSRRSESGNNSGQRSQSSTQSNKPGSKQVYSQNYWTN